MSIPFFDEISLKQIEWDAVSHLGLCCLPMSHIKGMPGLTHI